MVPGLPWRSPSTPAKGETMRIYPKNSPMAVIDAPGWGHFEADPEEGHFDVPDELSDELLTFAIRGEKLFEDQAGRSVRLHRADLDRRRDPASLYDSIEGITGVFGKLGEMLAQAQAQAQSPAAVAAAVPADALARIAELERLLAEAQAAVAAPAGDAPAPAPADVKGSARKTPAKPPAGSASPS
jgi:hypothetical protein